MPIIRVSSPEEFDTKVQEAFTKDKPVFVLFFGTANPGTSDSWCPDCVIADPLIRKVVLKDDKNTLLEAPVGLRDEWKGNDQHPYRTKFNVPAIPTLFKWSNAGPGDKLVEGECADEAKLQEFVQA